MMMTDLLTCALAVAKEQNVDENSEVYAQDLNYRFISLRIAYSVRSDSD